MASDRQQGISNHPVEEEVERQRKLPRRGTDRDSDTTSQAEGDRETGEEDPRRQEQRRSPV